MSDQAPQIYFDYSPDLTKLEMLFLDFVKTDKEALAVDEPLTQEGFRNVVDWINKCLRKSWPATKT